MATRVEGRIGDRYELSAVLGRGATGTVYAAKNVRTGRRVAIKSLEGRGVLDPRDPDFLRFEQEARIAGSLESQHVAQVLDIERDPATEMPFLVMELLRGEDLQSLLDRVGPLPVEVALRIAAQACSGLAAAHAAGVVHRDVKPANLFLSRRERGEVVVKLLDFGVAKIRRLSMDGSTIAASSALPAPPMSMTETGQLLGSPLYMSPEQVAGAKDIDVRSDIYSLGVTLYTMIAGKAPRAEFKNFALLLNHIATKPLPKLGATAPWVDFEVEAIVERAARGEREGRFSSAESMIEAMLPFLPAGTALREDMLVGCGEEPRETVRGDAASVPSATTAATERAGGETPKRAIENGSSRRSRVARVIAAVVVAAALVAAVVSLGR